MPRTHPICILYKALYFLTRAYAALDSYASLEKVEGQLVRDPNALDALALAYRTEKDPQLREGSFCLLIVALGSSLLKLAPDAQDGGELLEALVRAASEPGVPLLLRVSSRLIDERRKEQGAPELVPLDVVRSLPARTAAPSDPLLQNRLLAALTQCTPAEQKLAAQILEGLTFVQIAAADLPKRATKGDRQRAEAAVRQRAKRLRERLKTFGVTL